MPGVGHLTAPRAAHNGSVRTWSRNPGAGRRARAELYRDPARSDEVIAPLARCTPQTVRAVRRELEDAGTVRRVPVSERTRLPRPVPPSRTRDAIRALGPEATPRQVADSAGVSIQMAWRELTAQRAARRSALPPELAGGTCLRRRAAVGLGQPHAPGAGRAGLHGRVPLPVCLRGLVRAAAAV